MKNKNIEVIIQVLKKGENHILVMILIGSYCCLLSVIKFKNKGQKATKLKIDKVKFIYIRLHPFLNKKEALKRIFCLQEIPENLIFIFIKNNEESIIDSINKSYLCFFGLSTYINLAISLNANVVAVNTNHINKSPINTNFAKTGNFLVSNPW